MLEKYYPDIILDSVRDITPEMLKKNSVKGLILDIDNTLVATHTKEPDEKVLQWIDKMKSAGIKLCIVSNASQQRVEKFNKKLSLNAIHRAYKPNKKGFAKAAALMNLNTNEISVVGDQIFTDIYGGNKAGMKTILVRPIHKKEFFFVQMKRIPEKFVLKSYEKHFDNTSNKADNSNRKVGINSITNKYKSEK
jgi:HAD superfamily phosphatase (TIGR01668 family)